MQFERKKKKKAKSRCRRDYGLLYGLEAILDTMQDSQQKKHKIVYNTFLIIYILETIYYYKYKTTIKRKTTKCFIISNLNIFNNEKN